MISRYGGLSGRKARNDTQDMRIPQVKSPNKKGRNFFTLDSLGSYNPALMLNRLPVDVNPFRLVEQRKCLTGLMSLQQMPRLAEVVLAETRDFTVELEFTRSLSGLPIIQGTVRGNAMLECQRCMQPVAVPVDCEVKVALTTFESDERPEQEGYEAWLVEDDRLFLQDFVEDEILLALPLVARHEQCKPFKALIEALPEDIATQASQADDEPEGRKNPFAVLKDWKKTE
jgi:uncharacterized protein